MFNGNSRIYKYLERLKDPLYSLFSQSLDTLYTWLCFGIGFWIAYNLTNYIYG
jgi:hypothetical protein